VCRDTISFFPFDNRRQSPSSVPFFLPDLFAGFYATAETSSFFFFLHDAARFAPFLLSSPNSPFLSSPLDKSFSLLFPIDLSRKGHLFREDRGRISFFSVKVPESRFPSFHFSGFPSVFSRAIGTFALMLKSHTFASGHLFPPDGRE